MFDHIATAPVQLLEWTAAQPTRVERQGGVLRGVKVLGRVSRNGRRYSAVALKNALRLYEGARVNINHPDRARPATDRALVDRFGMLKKVRLREDGIYADLHYLRQHPLAEMIAEAAERLPDALGLSHNAEGRTSRNQDAEIVEEITRVISVDLVSDPASTGGLFESLSGGRYQQLLDGKSLAATVGNDSTGLFHHRNLR